MAEWTLFLVWTALTLTTTLYAASPGWFRVAGSLTGFAFAMVHGAGRYGWKGISIFALVAIIVINIFENMSVETGFPFGLYVHNGHPKLFNFPIIGMFGQFFYAYISWQISSLFLDERDSGHALDRLTVAISATFIVTGFDAAVDPILSTVYGAWTWAHGGGYFGVPLSNCLGWLLVSFTYYAIFALLVLGRRIEAKRELPWTWWVQPPLVLGLVSIRPLMGLLAEDRVIIDPSGRAWHSRDLFEATSTVSICTMMFVVSVTLLLAFARRGRRQISR